MDTSTGVAPTRAGEQVVETGLTVFVKVGNALLEIRDSRLYRQQSPTFEAYCRERWGLKQSRAYQLLDAAVVIGNLQSSTIVELPKTESQARPLTRLEPEVQRELEWAAYQRLLIQVFYLVG